MQPPTSRPHLLPAIDAATLAWAAGAVAAGGASLVLAAHHPLWPALLAALLAAWMLIAYQVPRAWLFVLPAGLPALNFSPWTGWVGIEELDLLVLATVAAGFARLASRPAERPAALPPQGRAIVAAWVALTGVGVVRGVADAGGWHFGWFQGHVDALNTLRVAKSAVLALLLLPLLRAASQADPAAAFRRFALGMVAGAAVMTIAALWERLAFPGLLDLSAPYRTVGLFWEMHVGGAAIDAYVVLCTTFVAWALWAARSRLSWSAAAAFALVWAYAGLTTFSRGAYLGAALALLWLGLNLPLARGRRWLPAARALAAGLGAALVLALVLDAWGYGAGAVASVALGLGLWRYWRARAGRRRRSLAAGLLALALIVEGVVVFGPESFMNSRIVRSTLDYDSRTVHWRRGVDLLHGPADWLLGLGLGRLPAHYDRFAPRGEFSGAARLQVPPDGNAHVRVEGPRQRGALGGLHGLTQRVSLPAASRLSLDVRAEHAGDLAVRLCESHLLYDRACRAAAVRVEPTGGRWRKLDLVLQGQALSSGPWYAPRQGVLTISVRNRGGRLDLDNIALRSEAGESLLANGDFSAGLAHWLPAAQIYFLPWHIDNLYLELLIERGLLGLLLFLGLVGAVIRRALRSADTADPWAVFLAAGLVGVSCVGLFSSILDVPRVALLMALMLMLAAQAGRRAEAAPP